MEAGFPKVNLSKLLGFTQSPETQGPVTQKLLHHNADGLLSQGVGKSLFRRISFNISILYLFYSIVQA